MESITKSDKIEYHDKHNEAFKDKAFATRSIHMGQPPEFMYGSVNVPIHMSSTYAQHDWADPYYLFDYGRWGNPTRDALEKVVASLENAKYALIGTSGVAMTSLILHLLKSGDHFLWVDHVYAGNLKYFDEIACPTYGFKFDSVDMSDLELLKSSIKESTKLLWLESPTNQQLKIYDIKAIADIWKEHNIISVIDNTLLTPYFQKPLDLGIDIVVHSASKYFGGHSDIIMGMVMTNNDEFYTQLNFLLYAIGMNSSPFDCYLVLRSCKTLSLRMEQIGKNALAVAQFLETHEHVQKVNYPNLPSHKNYEIQLKQATGGGGVVSFILKGGTIEKVNKFLKALKIFTIAKSTGGCESLASCTSASLYYISQEIKDKLGVVEGLVRLYVGIEDIEDLIADLQQSFDQLNE